MRVDAAEQPVELADRAPVVPEVVGRDVEPALPGNDRWSGWQMLYADALAWENKGHLDWPTVGSFAVVRRLSERFAAKGIAMLDAPVSGGPAGAKSGKLALYVSGDKAAFDKHKAVLDAIGDQVIYVGPVGSGTVAKLVHNAAGYAMQLALVEVFTMGVKAGVPPLALWAAIRQGSLGRQRSFDRLGERFLRGTYDPPNFALALGHKDMTLATELGREIGVPMRLVNLAHAEMTDALNRGWQGRDSRSYLLLQQERAGLEIRVPAEEIEATLRRDG